MKPALRGALAASSLLFLLACSGSGASTPSAPPPTVPGSAASLLLFEGQTATLNANAKGTGTLTYQWNRNGSPIAGATFASYTLPAVALTDNGAAFAVTVRNDGTPATSAPAMLTVDPALDLRFKLATGAPYMGGPGGRSTNLLSRFRMTLGDTLGSPLQVGSGVGGSDPNFPIASWSLVYEPQSGGTLGMTTAYLSGTFDAFDADVAALPVGDRIVTSLDLEEDPGAWAYGLSVLQTTQAGRFLPAASGTVALSDLQTLAAAEGAQGRVLTAVSFRQGSVSYFSYGWSMAPTATYEAKVLTGDFSTVNAQAAALAAEGYFITAFGAGHEAADGFVLVGTRASGATAPRPFKVVSGSGVPTWPLQGQPGTELEGFANVGQYWDATAIAGTAFFEK